MFTKLLASAALVALALPAAAQEAPPAAPPSPPPSPGEIVAAAPASEWVVIAPEDLLVMELAPDAAGKARRVVIQLMPTPFSQGWVENIRTLARAHWYDGIAVVRVQDNYVTQWGDPADPEKGEKPKPLPGGLKVMSDADYVADSAAGTGGFAPFVGTDPYADKAGFEHGFPVATDTASRWPVHCYGMVGVGRNLSPDTGTGAELYTVIGHAPRHLDRNIALVGRVVEGIEHLSSLPRGTGPLGVYEDPAQRVPIVSVRVASDLPEADPASSSEAVGQQTRPRFEYLSTEGESFARYAEARANRKDAFFNLPAGGADICNIPVPVRRVASTGG